MCISSKQSSCSRLQILITIDSAALRAVSLFSNADYVLSQKDMQIMITIDSAALRAVSYVIVIVITRQRCFARCVLCDCVIVCLMQIKITIDSCCCY